MTDPQSTVRARPRKTEKIAWILFALLLVLFLIFELAGRYHLDATQGLLILLIVAIVLLVILREKPLWNAHDAIEHVRKERLRYNHENLNPLIAEVQPAGKHWLIEFPNNALTFIIDPNKHRVVGIRVKTVDDVLKQTEKSEVLRSANAQDLKDKKTEEAMSALGYDPDDVQPEEESNE